MIDYYSEAQDMKREKMIACCNAVRIPSQGHTPSPNSKWKNDFSLQRTIYSCPHSTGSFEMWNLQTSGICRRHDAMACSTTRIRSIENQSPDAGIIRYNDRSERKGFRSSIFYGTLWQGCWSILFHVQVSSFLVHFQGSLQPHIGTRFWPSSGTDHRDWEIMYFSRSQSSVLSFYGDRQLEI